MTRHLLFVVLAGLLPVLARAGDGPANYTGHYELADNHPGRTFTMDLSQTGSRVHVIFCASAVGDPEAKPVGEGKGRVNHDGVLEFTFKDNFANEGSATFSPPQNGNYQVEIRVTKFIDPSPLHFYGVLTVKKTSDTLQKVAATN